MAKIVKISAEEILDSRGVPTIKTTVYLDSGAQGTASVPSGVSTGSKEALELRDGDTRRYNGLGVMKAIGNAQGPIFQAIRDIDSSVQEKIDRTMILFDRTENKSNLGANAILSVSLAVAVATANDQKIPLFRYLRGLITVDIGDFRLPLLMTNLIEGGKHANQGLDFQEFLIVPNGFRFFGEGFDNVKKLIDSLKDLVKHHKIKSELGMEGGFALKLRTNEEALKLIKEAIRNRELYEAGFGLALDIAANNLLQNGKYNFRDVSGPVDSQGYQNFLARLSKKYDLFSIEDPFGEDDWDSWQAFQQRIAPRTLVVGDDLTATNQKNLDRALTEEAVSGVIVKPNQIGTLSETLNFIIRAREGGLKIIISHRGGETPDSFISDLAVATNADLIKIGSPLQKERFAKYARLLQIEKELAGKGDD